MPLQHNKYLFASRRLSAGEHEAILQELADLESKKAHVAATIMETEAKLAQLKRDHHLIAASLKIRHSNLNPIRWVPFEVLGYIFGHYIEDEPKHIGRLQLVSRTWKATVLGHPSLWSRIKVTGPFKESTFSSYKEHINICMERSGELPLRITFEVRSHSFWPQSIGGELLTYLAGWAGPRWESFHLLDVGDRNNWHTLINVNGTIPHILKHATKLRTLVFDNTWVDSLPGGVSTTFILFGQRKLQELTLRGVPWIFDGSMAPFRHIVNLTLGWNDDHSWRSFITQHPHWLKMFPSVRQLALINDQVFRNTFTCVSEEKGFYEAKHVQELTIQGPVPLASLALIKFPSLRHLIVQSNGDTAHCFYSHDPWNSLDFDSVQTLTLACNSEYGFWLTNIANDWRARMIEQDYIRKLFTRFANLKYLEAATTIWRQIRGTFDVNLEELEDAAGGFDDDYYTLDSDTLDIILRNDWRYCSYIPE